MEIEVAGYAFSGGGRGIVRVDVSGDGGETWCTANLTDGKAQPMDRAWAWTFWECQVPVKLKERDSNLGGPYIELMCRATDSSYNVQSERSASIWNLRGLNNNSFHSVELDM